MKYEITKGSEKDFEGAPEWSTIIYNYRNSDTIRFCNGWKEGCKFSGAKEFLTRQYDVSTVDLIRYKIIAERRPITELVWDGEGLPPVGVECEHCPGGTTQTEWEVVKVLAINERPGGVFTDFWLQREDGSSYIIGNPYRFRPIRSPENVARDEGVKEIMETFRVDGELVPDYVAFAMWDAGYRKLEGK